MLRYFFALFALTVIVVVSLAGFRGGFSKRPPIEIFPDMDHQPKVKAQTPSVFFADGRSNRPPVPGTVPIGYSVPLRDQATGQVVSMQGPYKQVAFTTVPDYFNTGKIGDRWGTGIPLEVTMDVLERGRERYNISCKVCHGHLGLGNGMAAQLGLAAVANLHQERLRVMADGEIFNTITHGKNTMMGYGDRIQVPDRWAIVAYVRALQLAQRATLDDVPPEARPLLEQPPPTAESPGAPPPPPASPSSPTAAAPSLSAATPALP